VEWLAISLTPGLGPTKSRKLVEHFGSPEAVFRASLTELESAGIQVVSAQSLATGKSAELAREEIAQAAAAAAAIDLQRDKCISEGRALWVNKPGASCVFVDSSQLGGGLWSAIGW
jgi:DNA processing protein